MVTVSIRFAPSKLHTCDISLKIILPCVISEVPSHFVQWNDQNPNLSLRLRLVFAKCFWSSPRPISTGQLRTLLHFHLQPIYLVVFKGSYFLKNGISHLEGGFTLRCLQRLSLPDLATRPWLWQANRSTSGPSIPVLSY